MPESKLAQIKKIVANTDEHRTRARREAWDAIKEVLAGADEPEAEAEEKPEEPKRGPGRPRNQDS